MIAAAMVATLIEAAAAEAAEEEAAVVVVTDLTAHLALTRSASPAQHPLPVPRLAGEGR